MGCPSPLKAGKLLFIAKVEPFMIASQARHIASYYQKAQIIGTPEWFKTEIEKLAREGKTELRCHAEYIRPQKDALEVAGYEVEIGSITGKVSWK